MGILSLAFKFEDNGEVSFLLLIGALEGLLRLAFIRGRGFMVAVGGEVNHLRRSAGSVKSLHELELGSFVFGRVGFGVPIAWSVVVVVAQEC